MPVQHRRRRIGGGGTVVESRVMSNENSSQNSVTNWIGELKAGRDDAAAELWKRYFRQVVDLAKRRLEGFPNRIEDEEDVAVSVFDSLCEGAAAGRFTELSDRDDLWRLLVVITCYKSTDVKRRAGAQKRGGAQVRGESVFNGAAAAGSAGLDHVPAIEPTAEFLSEMNDSFFGLMGLLADGSLRDVARMRMQGYSNQEVAEALEMSVSSVERKLRLIRQKWSQELDR